jgi:hypothetical protein
MVIKMPKERIRVALPIYEPGSNKAEHVRRVQWAHRQLQSKGVSNPTPSQITDFIQVWCLTQLDAAIARQSKA